MSTALAVAAVTQALKNLLTDGVLDDEVAAQVGDVSVTALPPDRVPVDGADARSQLNLFLYQVIENAAWRNMGYPAFSSDGNRISNPPLALDLHYLLMAYGAQELHSEILLGYGMQVLHDTPQLSRDGLRAALTGVTPPNPNALPPQLRAIATSGLADQFELVKLTPEVLSTEEISRLWTAFGAKYRTSAAYVASCVLIQQTAQVAAAKPVAQANLKVQTFLNPSIDDIEPQVAAAGDTLTLTGSQLWQPGVTTVQIGAVNTNALAGATSTQVQVSVPGTVPAGVQPVYLIQAVDFGAQGGGAHPGFESNSVAFMLIPRFAALPATIARGDTLTLTVTPPVGFDQDVSVLFGEVAAAVAPRTKPAVPPYTTATISVTVPANLTPGATLVRLSVDGAQSAVDLSGAAPGKPSIEVT